MAQMDALLVIVREDVSCMTRALTYFSCSVWGFAVNCLSPFDGARLLRP